MFRTNSPDPGSQPQTDAADSAPVYSTYQRTEGYSLASADDANTPRAVAESAAIARELKEGTLSAFVGGGTAITGDVAFKTMLRVDGRFSGRISSAEGTLVVAAGGRVDANVTVAIARIQGAVVGDILGSDRIELGRSARVTGNIQAPNLIVAQGAVLDGSCRMSPPEIVSEPEPVTEAVAEPESASEPETAPETPAVAEVTAEADAATASAVGAEAVVEKATKVERKENVLGTRTRRTRTNVAAAKAEDDEPAANAAAG
jgi:cytoskeletal protein CcmA (bactofilin family)